MRRPSAPGCADSYRPDARNLPHVIDAMAIGTPSATGTGCRTSARRCPMSTTSRPSSVRKMGIAIWWSAIATDSKLRPGSFPRARCGFSRSRSVPSDRGRGARLPLVVPGRVAEACHTPSTGGDSLTTRTDDEALRADRGRRRIRGPGSGPAGSGASPRRRRPVGAGEAAGAGGLQRRGGDPARLSSGCVTPGPGRAGTPPRCTAGS